MASEPTLSSLAALAETTAAVDDEGFSVDPSSSRGAPKTKEQLRRHYIRALHKVIDESDIVILVLDARDPEGCRSRLVEEEVRRRESEGKKLVFVLNKIGAFTFYFPIESDHPRNMRYTPLSPVHLSLHFRWSHSQWNALELAAYLDMYSARLAESLYADRCGCRDGPPRSLTANPISVCARLMLCPFHRSHPPRERPSLAAIPSTFHPYTSIQVREPEPTHKPVLIYRPWPDASAEGIQAQRAEHHCRRRRVPQRRKEQSH